MDRIKQEPDIKQEVYTCCSVAVQVHEQLIVAGDGAGVLCPVCQKHFFYDKYLQQHLRLSHPTSAVGVVYRQPSPESSHNNVSEEPLIIIPVLDVKNFCCTHCQYRFKTKHGLTSHMVTHSEERPFNCPDCIFKFKRKGDLVKHSRHVHSEEKPFSCQNCTFTFKRKSELVKHFKLVHSEVRPFSCSHCKYKCKIKNDLTRHMVTHSEQWSTEGQILAEAEAEAEG